jgi:hypothetical protein
MLEYFLFKKLHNGNVVTLNVLPHHLNPYTAPCKSSTDGSNAAGCVLIAYS